MARRNLCPNPALANNTDGWASFLGSATRVAVTGIDRDFAYRFDNAVQGEAPVTPTTVGQEWTVSCWLRRTTGSGDCWLALQQRNTAGDYLTGFGTVITATTTWQQFSYTDTVEHGSATRILLTVENQAAGSVDMTQVLYEQAAAVDTYADGDTAGWMWDGTAGNSTSSEGEVGTEWASVTLSATSSATVGSELVAAGSVTFTGSATTVLDSSQVHTGSLTLAAEATLLTSGLAPITQPAPVTEPRRGVLPAPGVRVMAQRILTGEWLDMDLPVSDLEITWSLSGPTVITGRFEPEIQELTQLGLDAWADWIHVEANGEIRASGILQEPSWEGETMTLEAAGVSAYPAGIPYDTVLPLTGDTGQVGVRLDPLDVVRHLWAHVQSYPEANLGVTVDTTTSPVRIGTEKQDVEFETEEGEQVAFQAGPYQLNWWDTADVGREIEELATETPFDWRELVAWQPGKRGVSHHIQLGYPRLGRKRFELTFRQDENLLEAVTLRETADHYASQVVVIGSGEGSETVRGYSGQRFGQRLRRVAVLEDKGVSSKSRASAVAREEIRRRQALRTVEAIEVDTSHSNAPLGSFQPGDDILVQAVIPYRGQIALWHRITSYSWQPDADRAVLTLARSETFQ